MSAPVRPLQLGDVVAGCRLERLIAHGSMGALYGAIDLANEQPRALKFLALGQAFEVDDCAEAGRRFVLEAQAAMRLDHPDIVRVHGVGEEAGLAYLVMDLLGGCDLSRYTRPERLLPEGEVLHIGERLAGALSHAHRRGVVHRDLKPANVIVDWAAQRVTLTDFGLARLADAQRTRTGLVLGSPGFMAPELLAGQPADARTDLYALGVLLYQLLCGRLPFEADSLGELLRQVAQSSAPPLRGLRPELPPALDTLVAALLAKDPAERPPDSLGLARTLAALRAGLGGRT